MIPIDAALRMISAGVQSAESIGIPMNIAVIDDGGRLRAFARMDDALLGSIDIAIKKAETALLFKANSEEVWEFCKPGGLSPNMETSNGGLMPFAGGIPIKDADGNIIGSIGVSGGLPEQDGQVAQAAAESSSLKERK